MPSFIIAAPAYGRSRFKSTPRHHRAHLFLHYALAADKEMPPHAPDYFYFSIRGHRRLWPDTLPLDDEFRIMMPLCHEPVY